MKTLSGMKSSLYLIEASYSMAPKSKKKNIKQKRMSKDDADDALLKGIYYNVKHPAAYGSVHNLVKASGLSQHTVERWLRSQPTYTLHKTKRKRFPMAHYFVRKPNLQFQADLVDYSKFASHNQGYKFMLMIMDLFTRQAWAFPLRTKSGSEVASIFRPFFRHHKTERLQVDEGKEFYNKDVKSVLQDYGIELFSIYSETKAALVERLNRTIKGMLEKLFTATNSKTWIHVIDDVMNIYNNRMHRSLGMTPNEVPKREKEAFDIMYASFKPGMEVKKQATKKDRFPIGSRVRISKRKGVFGRGYEANWSTEEFFVFKKQYMKDGLIMYKVKDAQGEEIKGSFYPQELQRVERKEEIYQIDSILKERGRGKKKEFFVSWQGYPDTFNSWIPASAVQDIRGQTRQY